MKNIYLALKKFIDGKINADQLQGEFAYRLNACLKETNDEGLKTELKAFKKELDKFCDKDEDLKSTASELAKKMQSEYDDEFVCGFIEDVGDKDAEIKGEEAKTGETVDNFQTVYDDFKNTESGNDANSKTAQSDERPMGKIKSFIDSIMKDVTESLTETFNDVKKEIKDACENIKKGGK